MENYDVIIIGGGPAGLTAAIYASRARLSTLIIEKESFGGQIVSTDGIENYPGIIEGDTGTTLVERMRKQAESFGTKFLRSEVVDFDFSQKIKTVKTKDETFSAKGVILSVGASHRKLEVKGEDEFAGAGVSYCATCDGAFFKDIEVFVVGGGDTAFQEALFLTKYASKVTIIHRRDSFRATKILQDKVEQNEKISFLLNSKIKEIKGDGLVGSITVENVITGEETQFFPNNAFNTFGIFVFAGNIPNTKLFEKQIELNPQGYFIVGKDMKVMDGVYAAGDCIEKEFRQVVTATSDGAIAALELEKYIEFEF
ncbi:thioredoxin-disulfide reductase [[Eubacterium] yurii subsp. margaretiae ATCC 43715]|nr:thioredoxin-disulfide reductase [[Eubacterium] yurii subsp. margaretiae ATCC 43715]